MTYRDVTSADIDKEVEISNNFMIWRKAILEHIAPHTDIKGYQYMALTDEKEYVITKYCRIKQTIYREPTKADENSMVQMLDENLEHWIDAKLLHISEPDSEGYCYHLFYQNSFWLAKKGEVRCIVK